MRECGLRLMGVAFGLCLSWQVSSQMPGPVDGDSRRSDVSFLDSLLGPRMTESVRDADGLAARDALLEVMLDEGPLQALEWAVLVHGWLRAAGDPHMRVPFDRLARSRSSLPPPDAVELVDSGGPWSRFGPGSRVAPSARAAWLVRTWPWISVLAGHVSVGSADSLRSHGTAGVEVPVMEVLDHGAFVRWAIPGFGLGSDREFGKSFRRCVRRLRRSEKPVMLDLRGNLGGFRTRRHAVLGAFVRAEEWSDEWEGAWSMDGDFERVSPAPLIRVSRPLEGPVAVLLDGLSFSASLLLAQSLEESGRAGVFGCAPLGGRGGCSGNPVSAILPGSGLEVLVPSRQTELGSFPPSPFSLPSDAGCNAGSEEWNRAVLWLLSSDLGPAR